MIAALKAVERLARAVERGGNEVEHRLDGPHHGVALRLQLGGRFENAKGERRDDVVARDRADFVDRKVDRRRRREQHVGQNRQRHARAPMRAP